ncbi:MAG: lipopolysaccharide biosynthesis protein [Flavipsychrobacter sp.]|nr:lipopolysaccharide biosynthesis protein [Flavipsychrobacter sp.]
MGIVFRQSIKGTIAIAAGAVLGALLNYGYTFALTKEQLGYTTIFPLQAGLFHILVIFGLSSTILNFSNRYPDGDERRKILLTLGAVVPLAGVAILSVPYYIYKAEILQFFKPQDRALAGTFYGIIPYFVFIWAYQTALEWYLVSQSKVTKASLIKDVAIRALNGVLLLLLYFHVIGFSEFIYGIVGSYTVSLLLFIVTAARTPNFGYSFKWKVFSRAEYKEIFQYSWYHMLVSATLNMLGFVDVLLLVSLAPRGLDPAAVYGRAVFIVALMVIPYRAMSAASIPTLNEAYHSGDTPRLKSIFTRSGINILIAAIGMFLLIACNLDNLVGILPEGYESIKPVVLILMIGRLVDMATGLNTELTSVSTYYKFNFRISFLLVALLVLFCYLLIPQYDIYGAAWASTIALALFNIAKMTFLWVKMDIVPFTRGTLGVLASGAVAFAPGYFLPQMLPPVGDTLLRSGIIALCYVAMLLWLRPSHDLNEYLKSIRSSKRLF